MTACCLATNGLLYGTSVGDALQQVVHVVRVNFATASTMTSQQLTAALIPPTSTFDTIKALLKFTAVGAHITFRTARNTLSSTEYSDSPIEEAVD
jgi:hypothetical protein